MPVSLADFDYDLPPERIAQAPADRRDRSRLLVLDRAGGQVADRIFSQLPDLLREGDLLVVNDTRVVPARFFCRRASGGRIEGLFLREADEGLWEVLLRNAGRCKPGERLELARIDDAAIELRENRGEGNWLVAPDPPAPAGEILAEAGQTPLPPYIRREAGADAPPADESEDRRRYQTVFAARDGAVAAPTAGLHFTDDVLAALEARGVARTAVTLHVGLGTFAPVKTHDLTRHEMHSEWYELPPAAAEAVNAARAAGRRVVAVGTTAVRVLETVAAPDGRLRPARGWTDLFLYPPAEFRAVDALLTNFHLPRSTLLMLVAAFCSPGRTGGIATVLAAYRHAVAAGYRFYSYGDAMLIH